MGGKRVREGGREQLYSWVFPDWHTYALSRLKSEANVSDSGIDRSRCERDRMISILPVWWLLVKRILQLVAILV
jgi:hypothetical protein